MRTLRTLHIALAVLTFSSAASAFAEAPYPVEQPFVSTLSRAQVKQQLIEAEHQGLLSQGDDYPVLSEAPSQLSRQDVERQLQTAQSVHGDATYAGA
ncbi:DUF4148 domain-containing protein [Herbaspirillum sp. RV1423]|uniref:DUF4148 domain-containing protein n=1 Tax=Herbaspirillum sp. RV1423 TaxID=1443993 RepID=UPI0004B5704B|nr:DUF4148 domain-containing protein [Herbaspirillum sp. RV1423]